MSTSRTVTVWCDGLDESGCTEWVHAGGESTRGATDTQARADAKRQGWTRSKGRDLCPGCVDTLATTQPTELEPE